MKIQLCPPKIPMILALTLNVIAFEDMAFRVVIKVNEVIRVIP